jgi:hypothetical protein
VTSPGIEQSTASVTPLGHGATAAPEPSPFAPAPAVPPPTVPAAPAPAPAEPGPTTAATAGLSTALRPGIRLVHPHVSYFTWLADKQSGADVPPDVRLERYRERAPRLFRICVALDLIIVLVVTLILVAAAAAVLYRIILLPV